MDSMPTVTGYRHVSLNDQGWPVLEPSKFKVKFLVRYSSRAGFERGGVVGAASAVDAWADFLALAFYWDHQSEMDVLLAADELETERLLDRVELEG
jgi:hypothetical protein